MTGVVAILLSLFGAMWVLGKFMEVSGLSADRLGRKIIAPPFIRSWWSWIEANRGRPATEMIVMATLGLLKPITSVLTGLMLILSLAMLFYFEHTIQYLFEINNATNALVALKPEMREFITLYREVVVQSIIGSVILVVAGVVVAIMVAQEGAWKIIGGLSAIVLALVGAAGFVYFIVRVWVVVFQELFPHYQQLFVVSVSGGSKEILLSQLLMWAVNSLIVTWPVMIVSILISIPFRKILAPVLLTPAEFEQSAVLEQAGRGGWAAASVVLILQSRLGLQAGIAASFTLTALLIGLGHALEPQTAAVAMPPQLYFSNFAFDGITLLATVIVLGWLHGQRGNIVALPLAIATDLTLAVTCAVLSLWLGLIGTTQELSFHEVLMVLIAQDPSGQRLELGPYFWTMHSTFIPTLLFWVLIVLVAGSKWVAMTAGDIIRAREASGAPLITGEIALAQSGKLMSELAALSGALAAVSLGARPLSALIFG